MSMFFTEIQSSVFLPRTLPSFRHTLILSGIFWFNFTSIFFFLKLELIYFTAEKNDFVQSCTQKILQSIIFNGKGNKIKGMVLHVVKGECVKSSVDHQRHRGTMTPPPIRASSAVLSVDKIFHNISANFTGRRHSMALYLLHSWC